MAIVTVEILEGRDQETQTRLMGRITEAVVEVLGARPEQVRVLIHELPRGNYAVAGKPV